MIFSFIWQEDCKSDLIQKRTCAWGAQANILCFIMDENNATVNLPATFPNKSRWDTQ
jgi:hypothetical protein